MPILNLILGRQIILGMLAAACLFVPWNQRRPHFPLRLGLGMLLLFVLIDYVFVPNVFMWSLLLYVALLILLIWACFDCGVLHAVFSATCAYAVQHITSNLAYMTVMPLILKDGERSRPVFLLLLVLANALVGIPVFLRFTRPFLKKGQLMFDNVKTVICSGPFLTMAVFLSSVLERSFDRAADGFLMNYFALNASCILFAAMILALEFSNCKIKYLEHENMVLGQLLESDKLQYEQAKRDMEKINIRYHDLKQQYSRATDEERVRLEEEMKTLNLRYYTGNKAVDITLSQKAGVCEGVGVQLVCSVDGGCLPRMKHYHIYSLLGNAIDNAIECLMKVDDASRRVISLDISRCRDMAVIRMENYTPAMPVLQDGVLVTTKRDAVEHGYGMKSIKNIAESYGGTAGYFVEDEIFYLLVTLPCAGTDG